MREWFAGDGRVSGRRRAAVVGRKDACGDDKVGVDRDARGFAFEGAPREDDERGRRATMGARGGRRARVKDDEVARDGEVDGKLG